MQPIILRLSDSAGYDMSMIAGHASRPYDSSGVTSSAFSVEVAASWEIDIFGRVTEKAKGSKVRVNVTRLEYEGLMLSVAAEVVQDYADLRINQRKLENGPGD